VNAAGAPDGAAAATGEPSAAAPVFAGGAALLHLLHLVSPALPVGAYAYSQGLEFAIEARWVRDEAGAAAWLHGLAGNALGTLDLPVLLRLRRAWAAGDATALEYWNGRLLAARETAELRAEDRHLGQALLRILVALDVPGAATAAGAPPSFALAFGLAGAQWRIGEPELLGGYLWSWAENQVLAALKLVPLGQSAGQRLLHGLIGVMPAVVARAMILADADIGSSAVAQALASALHETQYTRLFRS